MADALPLWVLRIAFEFEGCFGVSVASIGRKKSIVLEIVHQMFVLTLLKNWPRFEVFLARQEICGMIVFLKDVYIYNV